MLNRRSFVKSLIAAPALVSTGGLIMTNTKLLRPQYTVMYPVCIDSYLHETFDYTGVYGFAVDTINCDIGSYTPQVSFEVITGNLEEIRKATGNHNYTPCVDPIGYA